MIKKSLLLVLLLALPTVMKAGGDDDFGTWFELGIKKNLPRNWDLGLEAEWRTEDGSSRTDRFGLGLQAGYRAHKYLKLGASYSFLYQYSPDKTKDKEPDEDDEWTSGYNFYKKHWTPRHRTSLEASTSIKLWKWCRISLRERYQYTYQPAEDVDRLKYREVEDKHLVGFENGQPIYEVDDMEVTQKWDVKSYDAEHTHYLRSRLKVEVDKKRLPWKPFLSVELQNDLSDAMSLHKVRAMVGTEYNINKQHSVQAAYVFSNKGEEENSRQHAFCVGYSYEF